MVQKKRKYQVSSSSVSENGLLENDQTASANRKAVLIMWIDTFRHTSNNIETYADTICRFISKCTADVVPGQDDQNLLQSEAMDEQLCLCCAECPYSCVQLWQRSRV